VLHHSECEPGSVLREESGRGGRAAVADIAGPRQRPAGNEVGRCQRGEQYDGGVEHGDIDVLPFSESLPLQQRAEYRKRRERSGIRVDDGPSRSRRRILRLTVGGHDTPGRLHDVVYGGKVAPVPALPVAGYRAIDDPRLELLAGRIPYSEPIHDAGPEILEHD